MAEDDYRARFAPSVRLTAGRRAVVDILAHHMQSSGLSAGEVYAIAVRRELSVAQASIYRILGELSRHGSVDQFQDAAGRTRYRLRDASKPWQVCIVAGEDDPRLISDRRLFEQLTKSVQTLGLHLSPAQVVTIRVA